jgi:hypothetical protein
VKEFPTSLSEIKEMICTVQMNIEQKPKELKRIKNNNF